MRKVTIPSLAFCSGFSIMCFQLLGGRMLAPYFGSSVYVWGSIITVFMLALALGYLLGGKFSLYRPNLKKYAGIFLFAALSLLPTIFFYESLLEWVFVRVEDPRYGSLLASLIVFLIPSIIMGMISPYSIRILTESTASSGNTAGFLYFISTLGSAIGTILTSFYLVLWLEVEQILWLAYGILFAASIIAFLISLNKEDNTVAA